MKEFFVSRAAKYGHHKSATRVKNPYLKEIRSLRKTIPEWDEFFSEEGEEARGNNWVRLDVLGQPLCSKYAWAIPNHRALNILAEFSPLVEVGCGKGYWASLLRQMGADILCFDKKKSSKSWTNVEVGGPKVLREPRTQERTLFLCYPDDSTNLAFQCLENFSGEYIIHVGELITTGTLSGEPQAPFGRTTGSDFHVALTESFHCLLVAGLPRFPYSKDCISVWKRTVFVAGKSAMLQSDSEGEKEEESEEEEGDSWASIPPEEVLPVDVAAPCLAHLLRR